eukprot:GHUV01013026.1.p1 GENE.GHUV01013026.1~~GHUV01013026.1.p1  ORF type:complete len:867 (+),score=301.03 GHUV01013026.1:206-2806(+)
MAAVPQLSSGMLPRALAAGSESFGSSPLVVQVLDVQLLQPKQGNTNTPRTKVTVSDGIYKCIALLAGQLAPMLNQIVKGAILSVNELVGNKQLNKEGAGGRKNLLIFLNLDVLGVHPETLGNPQPVPDDAAGAAGGAPAPVANGTGSSNYGGPPAGGYGAPPPMNGPAAGGGGMYGGPPPAAGPPGGGMYGNGPPQQQPPGPAGGMYGQQQAAPAGGMYGNTNQGAGANGPATSGGPGGMYGRPPNAAGGMGGPGGGMYGGAPAGPQYSMGHGPVSQTNEPLRITPIKALNPYINRWTIKARVSQKGEVRRWQNPRTEGKIMSFDLVDKDGGEIRATAWNDQVDQYQDIIQVGHVYLLSKCSLKPRNAKFNNTPHEYEIYLERGSQLTPCDDDPEASAIPHIIFNFKKLAELETTEAGQVIDVIGIVDEVQPWSLIARKDGSEAKKRAIVIKDDSGRSVELTLWGDFTQNPGNQLESAVQNGQKPVLAVKSARVGDFNGKSLSTLGSSSVVVEPDRPEAGYLRTWWDQQGGCNMQVMSLSERGGGGGGRQDRRVTFSMIENEGIGMSGQAEWVMVTGTIYNINSDRGLSYPSCTRDFNGRLCQKKLQGSDGSWYCDRCQQSCDRPAYRYLISLQAMDHTGHETLTAFGDSGEVIMGCPAEQIGSPEYMDSAAYGQLIQERMFTMYNFKLKVFMDSYNDEQRHKVSISKLAPLDYAAEGRQLLDYIHKLEAGQPIMMPQAAGPSTSSAASRGGMMGPPMGGAGPSPYGRGANGPPAYGGSAPGGYGGPGPTQYGGPGAGGANGPGGPVGGPPGSYGGGGGGGFQQQQGGGYGGPPQQQGGGGFGAPPTQQPQGGWNGGGELQYHVML